MAAGPLRHRVTFQAKGERVPDGGGGGAQPWEDQITVWGRLVPLSANETSEAGRLEGAARFTLTIRKSAQALAVTTAWRVVIDSVAYQIRSAVADERGRYLNLLVEQGVAT